MPADIEREHRAHQLQPVVGVVPDRQRRADDDVERPELRGRAGSSRRPATGRRPRPPALGGRTAAASPRRSRRRARRSSARSRPARGRHRGQRRRPGVDRQDAGGQLQPRGPRGQEPELAHRVERVRLPHEDDVQPGLLIVRELGNRLGEPAAVRQRHPDPHPTAPPAPLGVVHPRATRHCDGQPKAGQPPNARVRSPAVLAGEPRPVCPALLLLAQTLDESSPGRLIGGCRVVARRDGVERGRAVEEYCAV